MATSKKKSSAKRSSRRRTSATSWDIESELIEDLKAIRSNNNICWMAILSIALKAEPVRTRELMANIRRNDKAVTDKFGEIIDAYRH